MVIDSPARHHRDDIRREQLLARAEDQLIALADRVRAGKLKDPAKIGAAADRILRDSGVGRCFTTKIVAGQFTWTYNQDRLDYETRLLAGRYVLTTSLTPDQASTAQVVAHYQSLTDCRGPVPGVEGLPRATPGVPLDRDTGSKATSPSAYSPPSSKPSSPTGSLLPTSAIPTSPTRPSAPAAPSPN